MTDILHYEDLQVGGRWESPARTITETDVVNFACLTGDFDPLHTDHHFAATTPFRRPIAHGLLGMSILAGLSTNYPRAATKAFVSIDEWRFLKPIFFGDTVHALTEVIEREQKGRRNGMIVWRRQLINHEGVVAQEGTFRTLVALSQVIKRDSNDRAAA